MMFRPSGAYIRLYNNMRSSHHLSSDIFDHKDLLHFHNVLKHVNVLQYVPY